MEYFVSHVGIIFLAALFVAAAAVAWWALTERNARLIRQRAAARRKTDAGPAPGTDNPSEEGKEE